ncbi:MAG: hypothetical protein ACSHXY_14255 [Alphaproteobacteria bacterium]
MTQNEIPNDILLSGETVLWSHIVETPKQAEHRENKVVTRLFRIASTFFYALSAYTIVRDLMGKDGQNILIIGIIFGLAGLIIQWAAKTPFGQALQRATDRNVFQNGFVTKGRVVLFNHYDTRREIYAAQDISRAVIDFENGGYALKIEPAGNRKDSVLVGAADFKSAVQIIQTELIGSAPIV